MRSKPVWQPNQCRKSHIYLLGCIHLRASFGDSSRPKVIANRHNSFRSCHQSHRHFSFEHLFLLSGDPLVWHFCIWFGRLNSIPHITYAGKSVHDPERKDHRRVLRQCQSGWAIFSLACWSIDCHIRTEDYDAIFSRFGTICLLHGCRNFSFRTTSENKPR